ncbi:MAG: sugar phosphate isomerase/epimerase [Clostridiales bacterium]|nr:sugar phosphate isomerase/epimerase [Clostridiales bacterium]
MKLGFASAILPDQSFEYVVDFAAANGYRSVEMMCWPVGKAERRYAGVTHIDADALDEARVQAIREKLAETGVEISALGYYPNPLDPDAAKAEEARSHIKKLILAARKLDVNAVNTFIGRDQHANLSDNMRMFKKVWPDIIRFAEDNGVRVAIENCPMLFTQDEWPGGKNLAVSPRIWREMFSTIDSANFGLNYDPSHFLLQQMDYIRPIYEFTDKLFHVHIKDAKIRKDLLDEVGIFAAPLDYMLPKLPGLGEIDWGKFVSALTDVGYNGHIAVEVEDKAFEDTLEDRLMSLRLSQRYVSQFLWSE